MARLRFVSLGIACFSWIGVCAAQAEPTPVDLEWSAPANCPQQNDVQQQLMALLGQSKPGTATTPLHVNGAIEPSGERYRLTLRLERSENRGTRTIESDDCKSLGKAAAVIVGLLVQKERLLGRELSNEELSGNSASPLPNVESPPPKTDPRPTKPLPTEPPPPPPPARRWHILLRAPEAKVDALILPKVSRGLGFAVGLSIDSWRILVDGTLFQSQNHTTLGLQEFTATYRHRALQAEACHGFGSGFFELAPCAIVAGDYIASNASGQSLVSTEQKAVVFSVGGGISAYLHIQRYVALVANSSARFLLNPPEFSVTTLTATETAHKVPIGTVGATVAIEWIF